MITLHTCQSPVYGRVGVPPHRYGPAVLDSHQKPAAHPAEAAGCLPPGQLLFQASREDQLLDLSLEGALRRQVETLDGIQALLLTFGEIDPDAPIGDPIAIGGRPRRLPVLDATGRGDDPT